ncbi:MAG TPA: hypothetical protein VLA61_23380 [Ideonella sp.]|uniref:hypothetical protein n=1 Tax=Ideonella sp. TaxID=1929293 RepID=UPI002C912EF8|nr:hypothetical protein [Ideonella sp.]HSI51217.1 hypothetical protein [Ideonella sp.]
MRDIQSLSNPFMMMTDPEVILQAVERSDRLNRLQRRVCRPLDRPLIPKIDGVADFDAEIDHEPDLELSDEFLAG